MPVYYKNANEKELGKVLHQAFFNCVLLCSLFSLSLPATVLAWSEDGHKTVGAIADHLIQGRKAEREVKTLLKSDETLMTVSIWADCAKGVCHDPPTDEMHEFVTANPQHRDYHFTDLPFERAEYQDGAIGTGPNDVVHVIRECVSVLSGHDDAQKNPHKFTPRQALLLLSHFVGDIHQPLHVGTAYLDRNDHFTVPTSQSQLDSGDVQATHGDNYLKNHTEALHMYWDRDVVKHGMEQAKATTPQQYATALLKKYPQEESASGDIQDWPIQWVHDALQDAKTAHKDVKVGHRQAAQDRTAAPQFEWRVTLPKTYDHDAEVVGERAIVKAGRRLARVLETIWPD